MSHRASVSVVMGLAVTCSHVVAGKAKLGPWYQIGPFGNAAFDAAVGPEQRPGRVDLKARYGRLTWKKAGYTDGRVGRINMPSPAAMYFYRTIACDWPTKLTTYYGSDDAHVVWLGGEKLIANAGTAGRP